MPRRTAASSHCRTRHPAGCAAVRKVPIERPDPDSSPASICRTVRDPTATCSASGMRPCGRWRLRAPTYRLLCATSNRARCGRRDQHAHGNARVHVGELTSPIAARHAAVSGLGLNGHQRPHGRSAARRPDDDEGFASGGACPARRSLQMLLDSGEDARQLPMSVEPDEVSHALGESPSSWVFASMPGRRNSPDCTSPGGIALPRA